MHRKGFALIELLIVIAIIAILAAILYPVFASARDKAKQVSCQSNLKQIGIAFQMYLNNNNGIYPAAYDTEWVAPYDSWMPSPHSALSPSIKAVLAPYIKHNEIWRCPGDWGDMQNTTAKGKGSAYVHAGSSYGWRALNLEYAFGFGPKTVLAGKLETIVKYPASYSLAWDKRPWHSTGGKKFDYFKYQGVNNVLFCDGHMKALPQYIETKLRILGPDDPLPDGAKP